MNKFLKIALCGLAALVIIFAIAFKYFCPLLNPFPIPTGQYAVGNSSYHWIIEHQNQSLDKRNEFNVDVFYPSSSDPKEKRTFRYQPDKMDALAIVKAQHSYIPQRIWHCLLSNMYSYAEPNATISNKEAKYPVILYLPGISAEDLHAVYLEELASHGYVVVAIEPPYDTLVTVFPNNEIITLDSTLQKAIEVNNRDAIYIYRDQAHERWSNYIEITLPRLQHFNEDKDSIFFQKLDLNEIGLMGHSHGGAVVTDFCAKHTISKAGINMDGWTKTYNSNAPFEAPFLFLSKEDGEMPEMHEFFSNNNRPDFHKIIIQGAGHAAFSDLILVKQPITRWFGIVTKNAQDVRIQISKHIVSFFNKYLKHQ